MTDPHSPSLLLQSIIYLGAAVLAVPLSKRVGLGSVLGYLIAGMLIGPWGFGLIQNVETVLHFAEFGVVMMLFLIGLELNLHKLLALKVPIFGLGGLQVLLTATVLLGLGLLVHTDWRVAMVAGMGVAMSSTAIAAQTLKERGLMEQPAGRAGFAVLLFQDLAVIPLMLMLALLVPDHAGVGIDWKSAFKALGLVIVIVVGGDWVLRPVLRYIANTGLREIFIAFALFLIMGVAMLMQMVGLSMALGAFIAGVLLADSEYRQELELDIEPFKGLLLGLFFIAVGMSVDLGLIYQRPVLILGLALLMVAVKIALLFGLARAFQQEKLDAVVLALTLSQVGEFAFVLYAAALEHGIITTQQSALLNAVVAASMLTTPMLMLAYTRWVGRSLGKKGKGQFDEVETQRSVIVAGYGRFGQVVARLLNGIGVAPTVIEYDPNQIELVRRFGFKAYYGDITRPDVLKAAGIENAKLLVIAIDNVEAALATARYVNQHYPQVKIIARARNRTDTYEYMDMNIESIRETFHSGLEAGEQALRVLGYGAFQARRAMWRFQQYDEKVLKQMHAVRHDEQQLISQVARSRNDLVTLMQEESPQAKGLEADGWFQAKQNENRP